MSARRRAPRPPREGGPDIDTPGDFGGEPETPLGGGPPAPGKSPFGDDSPLNPDPSRGGEGPRERPRPRPPGGGIPPPATPTPTPLPPMEPIPSGGNMPPAPGGPPPLGPFEPLPGTPVGDIINPAAGASQPARRQFGGLRGLSGGGFGISDPTSDQESDPIQSLIQSLLQKRGGFGAF